MKANKKVTRGKIQVNWASMASEWEAAGYKQSPREVWAPTLSHLRLQLLARDKQDAKS